MQVIAGLGNPGAEYLNTRHNVGFVILDALAHKHQAEWKKEKRFEAHCTTIELAGRPIRLVKPQTYMNESGRSLGKIARYYRLPPVAFTVVYDDITLEPARLKLSNRGGDGGHNGILSLMQHLGTDFIRYRIGIGPKAHPEMELREHVLGNLTADEQTHLTQQIPALVNGLEHLATAGYTKAINDLNRRPKTTKQHNEPDSNNDRLPGNLHPGHTRLSGTSGDTGREA